MVSFFIFNIIYIRYNSSRY